MEHSNRGIRLQDRLVKCKLYCIIFLKWPSYLFDEYVSDQVGSCAWSSRVGSDYCASCATATVQSYLDLILDWKYVSVIPTTFYRHDFWEAKNALIATRFLFIVLPKMDCFTNYKFQLKMNVSTIWQITLRTIKVLQRVISIWRRSSVTWWIYYFYQYLAIFSNGHLPNSIAIGPSMSKILPSTKLTLRKLPKTFSQSGKISTNLITLRRRRRRRSRGGVFQ